MTHRRLRLFPSFVLLLALFLLAPACGGGADSPDASAAESEDGGDEPAADEQTPVVPGEVRYLAIGDSLTEGAGGDDPAAEAFPARLAKRWRDAGCTVRLDNAGISGYTAEQILGEQVPHIDAFRPTIITFQTGANDIANGVTEDDYRANVGKVLDAAAKSGARVFALFQNDWFRSPAGPDYGGTAGARSTFDGILLDVAKSKNVQVLDLRPLYKEQADRKEWVSDGLHPTAKAYDAWAERLSSLIPLPCEK